MKRLWLMLIGLSLITALGSCMRHEENEIIERNILNDARVGYEINVSSFSNGSTKNDGDGPGGDLDGVTAKLDYLKNELNVDTILLSPISESEDMLGYEVLELSKIKAQYGGARAYKRLIREAHKRGMYVILDLAINDTSIKHPWFLSSLAGDSEYMGYYRFTSDELYNHYLINDKYYYSANGARRADLNYDNPLVYNNILAEIKKLISYGTDGLRILDGDKLYAPDELDTIDKSLDSLSYKKGIDLIRRLTADIKKYEPNTFIMLDTATSSTSFNGSLYGAGVDSIYDNIGKNNIITSMNNETGQEIISSITLRQEGYFSYSQRAIPGISLSSACDSSLIEMLDYDINRVRASVALSMLLPGLSLIYQGNELGLRGVGKEALAFKWNDKYDVSTSYDEYNANVAGVDTQMEDPSSLLSLYHELTSLKKNDLVIRYGSLKEVRLNPSVAAFSRSYRGKTYLISINTSKSPKSIYYRLDSPKEIFKLGASVNGSEIKLMGYGISVLEVESIKAPDVEKIIFHYRGKPDYMLYEWSTGIPRWLKLYPDDLGYRSTEINIKGLNLSEFEFLVGKKVNGTIESSGRKKVKIEDHGNKICHIYLDEDLNEISYEIKIDKSFPLKPGQIVKIFAWKTTEDGSFYNTIIDNNKITFRLDKEIDNINIVIFDNNTPIDWSHTTAVSNDIVISSGNIITDIIWK